MSGKRAARRRAAKIRAKAPDRATPPLSEDSGSWDTDVFAELSAALRAKKDWDAYARRMEDFGLEYFR